MFSKETQDRVKLARQYIESTLNSKADRYKTILAQSQKDKQNWAKIMTMVDPGCESIDTIVSNIAVAQNANKRMMRQKDCLQNYKLYSVIGRGAFGQVRLAKHIATNEVVAIKRLQKCYLEEKKQIYNAYVERDFMAKNNCPFIVNMKSTFQDENYLYIAMEYAQGGDLLHLLIDRDIFTEEDTKFYIAQMVIAVQQIHKMDYIHRDIKPDNVLIDKNGHIKISDFGLSKHLQFKNTHNDKLTKVQKVRKLDSIKNKDKSFSKVGTPDYISPQVLTDKKYTHSVDLWSIGVIMFECLFGYPPFTDENSKQVCHKVAHWIQYLEFPEESEVSTAARMLILGLVNSKNKRLTIQQIKDHPFFQGVNWKDLSSMKPPFVPAYRNDLDCANFDHYELKTPWTEGERKLLQAFALPKKVKDGQAESQGEGEAEDLEEQQEVQIDVDKKRERGIKQRRIGQFKFAGFDFKRVQNDVLERTIEQLSKKKFAHQSLKAVFSPKKMNSKYAISKDAQKKYKLRKTKVPKSKPSQLMTTLDTIHNTRISTSKDLMRTLCNESISKQKQATRIKTNYEERQSIRKKAKINKIKDIYSAIKYVQYGAAS